MSQLSLSDYEKRMEKLAHNRALILKIVNARPGLTYEEIGKEFLLLYGFLPTIDNRIRELRMLGYVVTVEENGRLHVYPKNENKKKE